MCILYVEDEGCAGLGGWAAGLPGLALHREGGEGLVVGAALRHQTAGVLCNVADERGSVLLWTGCLFAVKYLIFMLEKGALDGELLRTEYLG